MEFYFLGERGILCFSLKTNNKIKQKYILSSLKSSPKNPKDYFKFS